MDFTTLPDELLIMIIDFFLKLNNYTYLSLNKLKIVNKKINNLITNKYLKVLKKDDFENQNCLIIINDINVILLLNGSKNQKIVKKSIWITDSNIKFPVLDNLEKLNLLKKYIEFYNYKYNQNYYKSFINNNIQKQYQLKKDKTYKLPGYYMYNMLGLHELFNNNNYSFNQILELINNNFNEKEKNKLFYFGFYEINYISKNILALMSQLPFEQIYETINNKCINTNMIYSFRRIIKKNDLLIKNLKKAVLCPSVNCYTMKQKNNKGFINNKFCNFCALTKYYENQITFENIIVAIYIKKYVYKEDFNYYEYDELFHQLFKLDTNNKNSISHILSRLDFDYKNNILNPDFKVLFLKQINEQCYCKQFNFEAILN